MTRVILLAVVSVCLSGCGKEEHVQSMHEQPTHEHRDDWVISASIKGPQLEDEDFQLIAFYGYGNMSYTPDSDFHLAVDVDENLQFHIDLNEGHDRVVAALESRPFRDHQLTVLPSDARIANVVPAIVNRRFKKLGESSWVDSRRRRLYLLYVSKPARLMSRDFEIDLPGPGYCWLRMPSYNDEGGVITRPDGLHLSFHPRRHY